MLFNSAVFLVFAVFFFSGWQLTRPTNLRYAYLVLCSFLFYGWERPLYLIPLLITATVDYSAGLAMERSTSRRKLFLIASLVANLGLLGFFKYSVFFCENLNALLSLAGSPRLEVVPWELPVGISFYTFQSINYTISVYRGDLKPTGNFLHFLSFIVLFPHLVAGPLVRARDILPQLATVGPPTHAQRVDGIRLIITGYFKKTFLADNVAPFVNAAFGAPTLTPSTAYWWLVAAGFAVQIYCDFSGYTDIARGLAKLMGIEFGLNFDHPYMATSFREFWQRWHISLSTWFRDYVYIPLGGARGSVLQSYRNVWITMLLSGFWHGAAWTFLAWGALHAFFLTLERLTGWPEWLKRRWAGTLLTGLVVFALVCVGWVFFRATSLGQALQILALMLWPAWAPFHVGMFQLALIVGVLAWELGRLTPMGRSLVQFTKGAWEPVFLAAMLWASIFERGSGSAFIYFQF